MPISETARAVLRGSQAIASGLSGAEMDVLEQLVQERSVARGAALLTPGDRARRVGVVADGLVAEYYATASGMRRAKWIARKGDFFGSLEDVLSPDAAVTNIVSLTPATVVWLEYSQLRVRAVAAQGGWSALLISVLEQVYKTKCEREQALLMLDAGARYEWFLRRFGDLETQISQEVVASFLGMTPVHLSRIRASRRRPGSKPATPLLN